MKVTIQETIGAPIEAVFDLVTNISKSSEHIKGIEKFEILSDVTSGLGLRWRETRVMFGKAATEEMEITAYDAPNSYHVEAESHGTHYDTELNCTAIDAETTQVTSEFSGRPLTLAAKLFTPLAYLFAGSVRKALHKDLLDLKLHLEGR